MPIANAYPPELARYVLLHWPAATPLSISLEHLEEALSAAFHASLTTEEARATRFRLLLTPVDRLPPTGAPNRGVLRLRFERTRALLADELRRLAPAVPFETSLIGAHVDQAALRIWGIAHSGPAWLAPSWGGRGAVPDWTHDPIIHVTGPGQLAVRCAGQLIGAIERGVIVDALMDVFDSEWLPAMFAGERDEIRREHAVTRGATASPIEVDDLLLGRVSQHMLRRVIQIVRANRHGGMVLVADTAKSLDGVRLKYRIAQDEPSHRYRALLAGIIEALSAASSSASVGWADFASSSSPELESLEQAVFEWSRVIANLAAIDGAVVLDKRFGLLGFGAEVSAELPSPARVWRALDTEASQLRPEEVESVGTRHRAAYRFINDHPGGLALVISHDGGVSFVANRDGEIVFWEQSIRF
jgi:hypothetical protein